MKEVLQIAYLRHLQDFYLFESVKDGSIANPSPLHGRIFPVSETSSGIYAFFDVFFLFSPVISLEIQAC